jgi:hypothetical protein
MHVLGDNFTRGFHPGNVLARPPSLSCVNAEILGSISFFVSCVYAGEFHSCFLLPEGTLASRARASIIFSRIVEDIRGAFSSLASCDSACFSLLYLRSVDRTNSLSFQRQTIHFVLRYDPCSISSALVCTLPVATALVLLSRKWTQ